MNFRGILMLLFIRSLVEADPCKPCHETLSMGIKVAKEGGPLLEFIKKIFGVVLDCKNTEAKRLINIGLSLACKVLPCGGIQRCETVQAIVDGYFTFSESTVKLISENEEELKTALCIQDFCPMMNTFFTEHHSKIEGEIAPFVHQMYLPGDQTVWNNAYNYDIAGLPFGANRSHFEIRFDRRIESLFAMVKKGSDLQQKVQLETKIVDHTLGQYQIGYKFLRLPRNHEYTIDIDVENDEGLHIRINNNGIDRVSHFSVHPLH